MQTLHVNWNVWSENTEEIVRYCSHCKKKVPFYDTETIRINANGKNRFFYRRFRCSQGHTWSKPIKEEESGLEKGREKQEWGPKEQFPLLNCQNTVNKQYRKIVIHLQEIDGAWRLDKLLATTIVDRSRNELAKAIKTGRIQVNNQNVLPKHRCQRGENIVILLNH